MRISGISGRQLLFYSANLFRGRMASGGQVVAKPAQAVPAESGSARMFEILSSIAQLQSAYMTALMKRGENRQPTWIPPAAELPADAPGGAEAVEAEAVQEAAEADATGEGEAGPGQGDAEPDAALSEAREDGAAEREGETAPGAMAAAPDDPAGETAPQAVSDTAMRDTAAADDAPGAALREVDVLVGANTPAELGRYVDQLV